MGYGNGGYGHSIPEQLAQSARSSSHTSDQCDRLSKNIEALHGVCADLEARLSPLTSSVNVNGMANENASKSPPAPTLVPFAETLRERNIGIENAISRLQSLLTRIEL